MKMYCPSAAFVLQYPQGGDAMRRIISWILVILIVLIFAYDIYFVIAGTIEVKNQLDRLEASNASGHEYLGVPIDIVVIGTFLISVVGLIFSIISSKIAQNTVIRKLSFTLSCLFGLMSLTCFLPMCV